MKCYLDIENSKTKIVKNIQVNLVDRNKNEEIVFDICNLEEEDLHILTLAIDKKLNYTDIELFWIENEKNFYYGTDYDYLIKNDKLIAKQRKKLKNNAKKVVKLDEEKGYVEIKNSLGFNDRYLVNYIKKNDEIYISFINSKISWTIDLVLKIEFFYSNKDSEPKYIYDYKYKIEDNYLVLTKK